MARTLGRRCGPKSSRLLSFAFKEVLPDLRREVSRGVEGGCGEVEEVGHTHDCYFDHTQRIVAINDLRDSMAFDRFNPMLAEPEVDAEFGLIQSW